MSQFVRALRKGLTERSLSLKGMAPPDSPDTERSEGKALLASLSLFLTGTPVPAAAVTITAIPHRHQTPVSWVFQHGLKTNKSPGIFQALRTSLRLHPALGTEHYPVLHLSSLQPATIGPSRSYREAIPVQPGLSA